MNLSVLFELPENIRDGLMDGRYERVGGVIRETDGKNIVLWLKEVFSDGNSGQVMPLSPQMQKEMQLLGLTGKIGLGVNLLTLGCVIVGFVYLGQKLDKIDKKLDLIRNDIKDVKEVVDRIDLKLDMEQVQRLHTATEIALRGEARKNEQDRVADYNKARDLFKDAKNQFYGRIRLLFQNKMILKYPELFYSYVEYYIYAVSGEVRCSLLLNEYIIAVQLCDDAESIMIKVMKDFSDLINIFNPDFIRIRDSQNVFIKNIYNDLRESCIRLKSYPEQIKMLEEKKIPLLEWENIGGNVAGKQPIVYVLAR